MLLKNKICAGSIVLSALVLFSACSSHPPSLHPDEGTDLVDSFNLSGDQFNKFKVGTPVAATVTAPVVVVKTATPTPALEEKKTKKSKKAQKEEAKKAALVSPFPKDFPPEYKAYDEKYRKYWESYKPNMNKGEEFVFKASYFGVTAGFMTMKTAEDAVVGGRDCYHVTGHMVSADYYRYVYSVDDRIDTFIDKKTFIPLKYSLVQRESGQSVDDLQLFDGDNYKTYYWFKRIKKGVEKKDEKAEFIPRYMQDSYSAIHFLRGFPLKVGDYYEFPIVTRARVWIVKAWVDEEEEISVNGTDEKALKIRAETHFPGVLTSSGHIFFWFSADPAHRPLRFEAKVKIGSIAGEVVKYTAGH